MWRSGEHHEPAREVERLEAQIHLLQDRLALAADLIARLRADAERVPPARPPG